MIDEQNHLLQAILQELKVVTAELQLLRSGSKVTAEPEQPAPPAPQVEPETLDLYPTEEEDDFVVFDWLHTKGVSVRNYRNESPDDEVLDELALFLGDRFATLWRLHDAIRRSLSAEVSFTLSMASRSQAEIADSTRFCEMLSMYAFLSSYRYNKDTKTIYAVPQKVGKIVNFFTGGWFERYIFLRLMYRLADYEIEPTYLLNPQIILPNGDDSELDLLFWVDNGPLWVECKTGDYQAYITKYSHVRKHLSIPKPRAILVILGISDDLASKLTHLHDVTVANEYTFLRRVDAVVGSSEYVPDPIRSAPPAAVVAAPPSNLFTLLNRAKLRPTPEYRQRMIDELIALVASWEQPMTLNAVKHVLAERVTVSKSQLQELLNAVMRSGCLLDQDGQPVLFNTYPFFRLISDDPAVLESKCVESYVRAVLQVDPDYFQDHFNRAEFERTVGAQAPDMATINRLKDLPLT